MKTILYNPIFINPQAYYVFPQLYDIEKGDSFIEPAVYSGYLIIEDLISNTSSQVINTREVDFTEFAGKRIRISQYTNIGAVVLGEWLLPEGEPSGPSFHQSLVDAWFMSGPSNSDKPSSITGVKGNDLALKNFAYSLSSGFGKYVIDFNSWRKENTNINVTSSSITITGALEINTLITYKNEISKEWKVEITGLPASKSIFYRYYEDSSDYKQYEINKNGVYSLPPSKALGAIAFICNSSDIDKLTNLTITQLPSAYEGALVFDGVDDYGICTGLPILDDYTVICRREIINSNNSNSAVASKRNNGSVWNGAFTFERQSSSGNFAINYGTGNNIPLIQNSISYQTSSSYNGNAINRGTAKDTDQLSLGCALAIPNTAFEFLKCVIYYFALYNKSLTPEEIETEKERLNEEWLKRKTE